MLGYFLPAGNCYDSEQTITSNSAIAGDTMRFVAPLLILLLLPMKGEAAWTGNELLDYCQNALDSDVSDDNSMTTGVCVGYIRAIYDQNLFEQAMYTRPQFFCIPQEASPKQVIRVVVKYLEDHPEELHRPAYWPVSIALPAAFPCE